MSNSECSFLFRSFVIFQMSIVRFFLSGELLSRNLHQFVPDRKIRQWIISLHYFFHKNTYCSKYWNIIHDCNNFDTANNFHSGQMKYLVRAARNLTRTSYSSLVYATPPMTFKASLAIVLFN